LHAMSISMILGGAIGNLIDRVWLGHVIDFLDVYYEVHHWPIFNIADSAITIGVMLLIIDLFRHDEKRASDDE
jgi:signal peptidase II